MESGQMGIREKPATVKRMCCAEADLTLCEFS